MRTAALAGWWPCPTCFRSATGVVGDWAEPAEPVMREIKVRQADPLSDPRRSAKVQAYQALASQCWCGLVLAMGLRLVLAAKNKAPQTCGLTVADGYVPEVLCPAPQRPISQSFPPRWLWPRRYTTPVRGSSRKRLWGN